MENETKNEIYDRLLEISFEINAQDIPVPGYINERLGQCHLFIEEVEKFSIRVSKEISITQRALNNAIAFYENESHDKMANDGEIALLPSIKDREAKVNNLLKQELGEIKRYQNEVSDLNNLFKAISLKIKNLNRANMDISRQIRLMESQIKLGANPTDHATQGLLKELRGSTIGEDSFKETASVVEESPTIDPTEPLDVDNLLSDKGHKKVIDPTEPLDLDNLLSDKLLDPAPGIQPEEDSPREPAAEAPVEDATPEIPPEEVKAPVEGLAKETPDLDRSGEESLGFVLQEKSVWGELNEEEAGTPALDKGIDLDAIIEVDPQPKEEVNPPLSKTPNNTSSQLTETITAETQSKGGNQESNNKKADTPENIKGEETPSEIDIDSLLDNYT